MLQARLSRSPDLGNQRTGNIQFNRRLWRWLHLSRKCHAKGGKRRQKCGKRQQRKEKAGCGNLPQLAEFVRLATPLARFGKVVRTASKQGVGSSNLPGRAISFDLNELEKLCFTPSSCEKSRGSSSQRAQRLVVLSVFSSFS